MRKKHGLYLLALIAMAIEIGCEPVLETGYKPRPLNATETVRRAYYAPAFTPDSMGEKKDDTGAGFGLHP